MGKIRRLVGGAGTGKTTALLQMLEERGGDPFNVGFISFSRAARREASSRAEAAWNIEQGLLESIGWFRTVHSLAYRCLKVANGELLTWAKADVDWLSEAFGVRGSVEGESQGFGGDPRAAAAMTAWRTARSTMSPLSEVVQRMQRLSLDVPSFESLLPYVNKYESAKRIDGRLDFEDLLMKFAGIKHEADGHPDWWLPSCDTPEGVDFWIIDEAQDNSRLLDACCSRLARASDTETTVIAGDPFQSVMSFNGADWRAMMAWEVDEEVIMRKSWRCPDEFLRLGECCLRPTEGYFDRKIDGAGHSGVIRGYDDIPADIEADSDTMIVSRTRFRENEVAEELKLRGIPYRKLGSAAGSASRKAIAFEGLYKFERDEPVREDELMEVIAALPSVARGEKVLRRGAKTEWKNGKFAGKFDLAFQSDLVDIGATDLLVNAIKTGQWTGLIDGAPAWRRSVDKYGVELTQNPKVRIGTVHSSKGLEAENVIVYCPTSGFVHKCSQLDKATLDEEHRIAYVAVTRAKSSLRVVRSGPYNMEVPV